LAIRTLANMSGSDRPFCIEHAFGWRAALAYESSEPSANRRVLDLAANLGSLSSCR
jgi:hypothetical protein